MTPNTRECGDLLRRLFERSPYFYFLCRNADSIGIKVDADTFLLSFPGRDGGVRMQYIGPADRIDPQLWLILTLEHLRAAVQTRAPLTEATVRTGTAGQTLHPFVERLLLRCLDLPPFPVSDRAELIYPATFGPTEPKVVWQSARSSLRVLEFAPSPTRRGPVCVSDGFTDPDRTPPPGVFRNPVSGFGYELVAEAAGPTLLQQFVGWVKYLDETHNHILPGNWLEYQDGATIPGTSYAGYLVVAPDYLPPTFPVHAAEGHWHFLLPVGSDDLEEAKRTRVNAVAQRLLQGRPT